MSLIDNWANQNNVFNLSEGDTGLDNLNKLCQELGSSGHTFKYGTPLEAFLSDNPGACEALLEWIEENYESELEELAGDPHEEEM